MFRIGERDNPRGVVVKAFLRVTGDACAFQEFVNADSAAESGGGVGGEAVAWACDVVAGGYGGIGAYEYCARVSEFV